MNEERKRLQAEQEDESLVLESIFGDEARFAKNQWKVWRPIDVTIRLTPVETESHCGKSDPQICVDLHVICTDRYPKSVPTLKLENVKGISAEDTTALETVLQKKAQELEGNPVVLELCSLTRTFLYEKRKPPAQSFHQGMLQRAKENESEFRRQRQNSEAQERKEIADETERRKQERQWQLEEEEEGRRMRESELDDRQKGRERTVGGRKIVELTNATVSRPSPHPLCHEWMGMHEREPLLISEWKFVHNLGREAKKELDISVLEERLDCLGHEGEQVVNLEDIDATIVPISFLHVERTAVTATNINVKVFIGQRMGQDDRCLETISASIKKEDASLRRLALHSLCGLRWLHDQNLVHASLSPQCIWMRTDRAFRLSDYVTLRLLLNVADAFKECITTSKRASVSKETVHLEKPSRKKDLFALGCIMDKTALRTPESSSESASHSSDLGDFIQKCQGVKVADELLDHPYLVQDVYPSGSDAPSVISFSRHTRLVKEFLVLRWLGKGGFGEVTLARNKLDGNDYAVKTIALRAGKERLNRRVTREAKLFSKLNHPHVVRYFAAWTEEVSVEVSPNKGAKAERSKRARKALFSPSEDSDSMMPTRLRQLERRSERAQEMSEWSTSFRDAPETDSDSSDSSQGLLPGKTLFSPNAHDESDFDILFEGSGDEGDVLEEIEEEDKDEELGDTRKGGTTNAFTGDTADTLSPATRILYIQMEYCEKSTLRHMIDRRELEHNARTIWRLFGEILQGLQYIHRQGMIHRDIKPMNILLDGRERVKIGDFGLATRHLLFRRGATTGAPGGDSSTLTKDIGTELYMAPELLAAGDASPYTNKIDVYSTGVILFEMFYRALPPGMERISTIQKLKAKAGVPVDFGSGYTSIHSTQATRVIESMLAVDPAERPTVDGLLEDDRLPLGGGEDGHFQKQFVRTAKKRSGRLFEWMMNVLLQEKPSAAQAYCYDQAICKERFNLRREASLAALMRELSSLIALHCFVPLSAPLLIASSSRSTYSKTKPVLLLDQKGFPVTLPMDLRLNFVHMCARNAVHRLKRFAIGRVFGYSDSQESQGGVHPAERWECSLDSIGPASSSLTLSLSVLAVAVQAAARFILAPVRIVLRVGHVLLVKAALRHLAVSDEKHAALMHALAYKREVSSRELSSLLSRLQSLLPSAANANQLRSELSALLKSRVEEVRTKAMEAVDELTSIMDALKTAEEPSLAKMEVVLDASLVQRPEVFKDGIVFQVEVEMDTARRGKRLVALLVGGRYDSMLLKERSAHDSLPPSPLALVGCSISLEALIAVGSPSTSSMSVLLCSVSNPLLKEKLQLAARLRSNGIAVDVLHDEVEHVDSLVEHCESSSIPFLVVFLSGGDEVLLHKIDGGEKSKMSPSDAVTTLSYLIGHLPSPSNVHSSTTHPSSSIENVISSSHHSTATTAHAPAVIKSIANVAISYGTTEKQAYNTRKRIEMQIQNTLADTLSLFSPKVIIDVIVVEVSFELVKTIAGQISRSSSEAELTTMFDVLGKSHGKSKQDLEVIYACLLTLFKNKVTTPIVLFRHQDNSFRCIV